MTYLLALLILPYFASLTLANSAIAILYLNQKDSGRVGSIEFSQMDISSNVSMVGTITGLGSNEIRGLHIHEFGNTTNGCYSVGGHFNPENTTHGDITNATRHVGDLGNIVADSSGNASFNLTVDKISLFGCSPNFVLARAIVLHQFADDFTGGINGTGNSGDRYACGAITIGSK